MLLNNILIKTLNYIPTPIYIIFIFFFLLGLFSLIYKSIKLQRSGMPEIDKMSGEEFESFLGNLFRKKGYLVTRTGSSSKFQGDSGADLVIEKDGTKRAVQAKRWRGVVTEKSVQEVVAAKAVYGCTEAMVVTNSYFSKHAKNLAKANNVTLWDRNILEQQVQNNTNSS